VAHALNRSVLAIFVGASVCVSTSGCEKPNRSNAIVGTWLVHDSNAPFPMHMYVFNADGTMQQANPDAGDAHGSDSDGKGIWTTEGSRVRGKWIEVMADRATHRFTGRGEYSFEISTSGDRFAGKGTMHLFDVRNVPTGAVATSFTGSRVTLGD
jgi:hypothetical protein